MFHNKFLGQFALNCQSRSLDDSDYPTANVRKLYLVLEILSILRLFCDVKLKTAQEFFCRRETYRIVGRHFSGEREFLNFMFICAKNTTRLQTSNQKA